MQERALPPLHFCAYQGPPTAGEQYATEPKSISLALTSFAGPAKTLLVTSPEWTTLFLCIVPFSSFALHIDGAV
jgi:hypothetical protein